MLVLSRKVGERIVINENITVVVQRLSGNRVALGIEAPPEVSVLRGELRGHDQETAHEPLLAIVSFNPESRTIERPLHRVAR